MHPRRGRFAISQPVPDGVVEIQRDYGWWSNPSGRRVALIHKLLMYQPLDSVRRRRPPSLKLRRDRSSFAKAMEDRSALSSAFAKASSRQDGVVEHVDEVVVVLFSFSMRVLGGIRRL